MPSQLRLLKSNAVLVPPTAEAPYHQISMTNSATGCTILIAATKPFPSLVHLHPNDPTYQATKAQPDDYVSVSHGEGCTCASYSKDPSELFLVWRHIHAELRYNPTDQAAWAFYPEFEYEDGEMLAHASLTASLALGKQVPECYDAYGREFGTPAMVRALKEKEREERAASGEHDAASEIQIEHE
ncbi:hypothetical protein GGS24DRAFT_288778 [Hypoxylon argillaceum]|nr:hypothetical protein GGS24DRAFT_288778 [Hypoxylon argillaceum]